MADDNDDGEMISPPHEEIDGEGEMISPPQEIDGEVGEKVPPPQGTDGEGEKISPQGTDWEVLTESTYAGAPDPITIKSPDEETKSKEHQKELSMEKVDEESEKNYEEIYKSVSSREVAGIQFFEEINTPVDDMGFGDGKTTRDLNLVGEKAAVFNAFNSEKDTNSSIPITVNADVPQPDESKIDESGITKEQRLKESSHFWSVVVVGAAALAGLAILGHQLHINKLQFQHIKQKLGINNERINRIVEELGRIKGILAAGTQHIPLIHNTAHH